MTPEGLIWGLLVWVSIVWSVTYAWNTPNETIEEMRRKVNGES